MMDMVRTGERIAYARKKSGMTQAELAEKTGVTVQAVSKWENGHNLPDIGNMMKIAEMTNVPYTFFLETGNEAGQASNDFPIRDRLFQEDNMYTRIKTFALSEHLPETYQALQYMRERHAGQYRKQARFTSEQVLYINHPLTMACHAHAMGIRDDQLLAAILLHDVAEDTGVRAEDMPFSEEVRNIVDLVTFTIPDGYTKAQAKEAYYRKISENGKACVVKVIDRCNNVSTMTASFSKQKLKEYIAETEQYILPLTEILKNNDPEYSDLSFLVKYQIISILETIKNLMASGY